MDPIQELVEQLKDPDPFKRREAVIVLRGLGPEAWEALPALRRAMCDPDWYVANLAAAAFHLVNAQDRRS